MTPCRSTALLAKVGIRTLLGATKVKPQLTEREHYELGCALLGARGVDDAASAKAMAEGTLLLQTMHYPGHALPRWRHQVARINKGRSQEAPWRIKCPRCMLVRSVPQKPLKLARGWPKLRCNHCQEEPRVGAWQCQGCLQQVMRCDCPAGAKQPEPSQRARRIMRLLSRPCAEPVEAAAQAPGNEQELGDPSSLADPGNGQQRPLVGAGASSASAAPTEAAAQAQGCEQDEGDGTAAGGGRLGEVAGPLTSRPLGANPTILAAPGTGQQHPMGGKGARGSGEEQAGATSAVQGAA